MLTTALVLLGLGLTLRALLMTEVDRTANDDVVQELDDPTRFVLVEVYRDADAAAAHKQTAHYAAWRDTVADLMAEPRRGVKYRALAE